MDIRPVTTETKTLSGHPTSEYRPGQTHSFTEVLVIEGDSDYRRENKEIEI